jgi:hypothetical protein
MSNNDYETESMKQQKEIDKKNRKHLIIAHVIGIILFPVWFLLNIFIPLKYIVLPIYIILSGFGILNIGLSTLVFIISPSIWDILMIPFLPLLVVIGVGFVVFYVFALGAMGESL